MIRNSSGHIVKVDGMAARMLAWLSENYNFTLVNKKMVFTIPYVCDSFSSNILYHSYSVLQVNDTALDPSGNHKGLISYLLKGVMLHFFKV